MARGVLTGALMGGVASLSIVGAISILAPPPLPPELSDAAPGAAEAPDRITQGDSGEAGSASDRAPVTGQVAPQAPEPERDTLAVDPATTITAIQPETGSAEKLETPAAATESGATVLQGDEPVLPNPQALAPMEPAPADELSISTEPAQPPAPAVAEIEGAFETPAQPEALPDVAMDSLDAPAGDDAPEMAPTEDVVTDVTSPDQEVLAQEPAPQVDATQETGTLAFEILPDVAPEPEVSEAVTAPETSVTPPPAIVLKQADNPDPVPQTEYSAVVPNAPDRPAIGTPAMTLTERTSGVTINRPGADATAEVAVVKDAPEIAAEIPTGRPLEQFSEPVEIEGDKPLMSVVLIDDGSNLTQGAAGLAALRSFPYPLTFAVDTGKADAAERMALYRAEGFEVLAMINLPNGAQPSDAETTFGVTLPKFTEVVGVLEGVDSGFQGSKQVSDQVTAILAQSGHGLVTQDKGLNTMPKLARKDGVPAAPVFRDFDSKGQTATVIRRFLDQAAFKAGQEGAVIMLGRLRPDTITALLQWGLQDRAGQVALVPVSAVLLRDN
ncbi:Uncharacterized conserved protein YibQ, putative polysaccharide deacetylase 2 family [Sulfitobacter brevis]|uniref:Uncharacterized conserved protein YibQ, putative polysaccharide deacetylase 2 family n=1 Tax=Sulfitobacter brevis TaxID=74348 RepID=A0A1I2CKH7_9RHOB|nr:divergent polysaccharide deacetylase family protein [Sulfitobacter brevis]SFE68909.1 Uncharacterized conserved protein YibQ, putative polysaccharide deacetylase 2 family [Sulfitobacter brevis]